MRQGTFPSTLRGDMDDAPKSDDFDAAVGGRAEPEIELPVVAGRQCVPVRLLPHLTNWWPLSPDRVAELLGTGEPLQGHRWEIFAYLLRRDGTYSKVLPGVWANLSEKLAALAAELKKAEVVPELGRKEWERRSVETLPSACFLWRNELEAQFSTTYKRHRFIRARPEVRPRTKAEYAGELRMLVRSDDSADFDGMQRRALDDTTTLDGDGSLYFAPVLTREARQLAFEGFDEHFPGVAKLQSQGGRSVRNKGRRDVLVPLIEKAQEMCDERFDTASVWARLCVMADQRPPPPPLIGRDDDGALRFRRGSLDKVAFFKRSDLSKRLRRQAEKARSGYR